MEGIDHNTYSKEGVKIDCNNYRGILLLPNTYKDVYNILM